MSIGFLQQMSVIVENIISFSSCGSYRFASLHNSQHIFICNFLARNKIGLKVVTGVASCFNQNQPLVCPVFESILSQPGIKHCVIYWSAFVGVLSVDVDGMAM